MEFKFNVNADIAKSMEKGVDTGIHKVKILKGYLGKTKGGNNILDLEFETMGGAKSSIFNICIDEKWTSGSENFDFAGWNELALCAGMKTGATYETTRKDKDGKDVSAIAFKELEGKIVNLAIYFEVDVYNNAETRKRKLSRVFFENGLSIAEKEAGKTEGKTMQKLDDRLADYYTKAHKEWQTNGGTSAGSTTTPASQEADSSDEDLI
mgnify:FL=1